MRHFTIPVFVPELACPNRCIFCNQRQISGTLCQPGLGEANEIIEKHLSTIPAGNDVEIGFFGGNFTGIEPELQENYLRLARRFIEQGRVKSIRLSTRPDYINSSVLDLLEKYSVSTIELGAQSLDEEVLKLSGRGHTAAEVETASCLIRERGFSLGLQMMIGLPGDTREKSIHTAREFIRLGAHCTRIYPTLVINDTVLQQQYLAGHYVPLSLEEAVSRVADLVPLFVEAGIRILRIGLHPSEGLLNGENLAGGPFHVAFGEMVYSEIWNRLFSVISVRNQNSLTLTVPAGMRNAAIGHKALNRIRLQQQFRNVKFVESTDLNGFEFYADSC